MSWSINVKTVGSFETSGARSATEGVQGNFTVKVSPEDDLDALYSQIENHTGLRASQQQLIYRGRLIGGSGDNSANAAAGAAVSDSGGDYKIRDILGLCDGETIHLLRRRDNGIESAAPTNNSTSQTGNTTHRNEGEDSGSGAALLLAELLGLGNADDQNVDEEIHASFGEVGRGTSNNLTTEDLVVPDPGSMEPVRQGLLTLHTLLPHASIPKGEGRSHTEANLQWYKGQWIDCRDNLNLWYEATIVDIADPDVVLPPQRNSNQVVQRQQLLGACRPTADSAVMSLDLDGRRRLLLEPCGEDDPDNEGGDLTGWRRRQNNDGVQLLLIHYNSWSQRWDEWIRSDSERIRAFRTRTKHPPMAPYLSPTPETVFNEAPSTFIQHDDVNADRNALLPELSRVVAALNDILAQATGVSTAHPDINTAHSESTTSINNLPWLVNNQTSNNDFDGPEEELSVAMNDSDNRFGSDGISPAAAAPVRLNLAASKKQLGLNRKQLELLAPILDRLGRTLTDAAPHVASLAASLPQAEIATGEHGQESNQESSGSISGHSSLLSPPPSRRNVAAEVAGTHQSERVNPDHADFASGLVNTKRGEVLHVREVIRQVRGGPRTSLFFTYENEDDDDGSGSVSLLAALLSLGNEDDQNMVGETSVARGRERQLQTTNTRPSGIARRETSYRLTTEDLVVPDPGSMEPVRQGLMTLHTLLPHASIPEGEGCSHTEANRQWYKGQWIDCLDTVNMWLEATIVDIADPAVVLPSQRNSNQAEQSRQLRGACRPTTDSTVSSTDLNGRRRLLLEPCGEDDPNNEGGDLTGWRRRQNNDGVQLLLIHYNGWHHRWDEWIRSDSERIRAFRTRTQHPPMTPYLSPTPETVLSEAPPTFIRHNEEDADRNALLPELCRVVTAVNDILAQAAGVSNAHPEMNTAHPEINTSINNLPWLEKNQISSNDVDGSDEELSVPMNDSDDPLDSDGNSPVAAPPLGLNLAASNNHQGPSRQQLELLAPILDRLGRTLSDAAPHVASLAASPPQAEIATGERVQESNQESSGSISGHSSLLSPPTSRRNGTAELARSSRSQRVNPDHADFASGLVNTYRVRGSPRSTGTQDDGPGLISQLDEDGLGLFSDLYTENPATADPVANDQPGGFRSESFGGTDDNRSP